MCACTPMIRTPNCGSGRPGCPRPWNAGLNPLLHTPTPGQPSPAPQSRCLKCGGTHRAPECWPAPPDLEPLTPSPARDVPRVDAATADVERLARFLYELTNTHERQLGAHQAIDLARAMVRDFDELEEILAEILTQGGRF